jgi:hypothetical protein
MQNLLFRYLILEPQKNTNGVRDIGFGKFFDRHPERSQNRLPEEAWVKFSRPRTPHPLGDNSSVKVPQDNP